MTKFFQAPSPDRDVSCRHREAQRAHAVDAPLTDAQAETLASWDQSPPAQRAPTAPATPAARRFQGWRVP